MKALLIVAHGSRVSASNEEIRTLTARVAQLSDAEFGLVRCAFLELAEPSIGEGLQQLLAEGASEICVFPYFLSRGRHVQTDVPADVDAVRAQNPDANIYISDYLGSSEGMAALILSQARNS